MKDAVIGGMKDAGISGMDAGAGGMQESLPSHGHHKQREPGNVNQEVTKHWFFWNFPPKGESKP